MNKKYTIDNVNMENIRNRNETRVIAAMQQALAEYPSFQPQDLDLQDIYAYTLNILPPRYVQSGTIVLNEEVNHQFILEKVHEAIQKVQNAPKY